MDWRSQFVILGSKDYYWLSRPAPVSLNIIADLLIAIACFLVLFSAVLFLRRRNDLESRQRRLTILFALSIGLCGLTRVASILVLAFPIDLVAGLVNAAAAAGLVASAICLVPLLGQALRLPSGVSMRREIETRCALERDLRQSAAMLATVIEVVPGLVYAKDRSGRLIFANAETLALIGKTWAEVDGGLDSEFLGDAHQAGLVMTNDRRAMETGARQEVEEIVDHCSQGTRIYQSIKVPLFDDSGAVTGLVGLSADITEGKRTYKQGLHVARRTAMGEVAATIAHELNQPLAAIAMYISGSLTLLEQRRDQGPVIKSLTVAQEQCLRAGEIIRRVRSFVSAGDDVKRHDYLAPVVEEACGLAMLTSRDSRIAVSIEHDDAQIPVLIDRVQIIQVVVNLVRNAIDAMGDAKGMSLRITTGCDADGQPMVSVSDSGPGVDAEVADHLFEPFVSTKGTQGMGVGLSICRTIVESHGGRIWVDRDAASGATFRFTLPSLETAIAA